MMPAGPHPPAAEGAHVLATWWLSTLALAQEVSPPSEPGEVAEEITAQETFDAVRLILEHQETVLAEQEAALEAQQALLAEQQQAIEALTEQVAKTKLALIPKEDLKLEWEGHYRIRGYAFNHLLAAQTAPNGDYRDARYVQQRLWLRPIFRYRDLASLHVEIRALDDILVGDNASLASTAVFAETPSNTTLDGQEIPSVNVSRAWMEFRVPIGLLRLGRQPAQWGMGLLANDGESFDHHFGESHYGNTNDRFLFATKPIAIFDKIAGREDSGIPLIAAVAVDRLVEDPLIQYHGYKCAPGLAQADSAYDRRCDTDGDGVTDLDHGYTDDTRTADQRSSDWWVDQNDDVVQMVYVVAYTGEDIDYLGGTGDLTAGVWAVHRTQKETESNVLITDFYFKSHVHSVLLEGELIRIAGTTRAIALPGSINDDGDPLLKKAGIMGYAARAGYVRPSWKVQFEHGFASGDDRVADGDFSGRPLSPDHNVGLLLYEEVISRVTAQLWTDSADGLWSKGGVYNSRYVFPTVHVSPIEDWELLAGFVAAWPHKPDGAIIGCRSDDAVECATPASQQPTADMLGWEIDVGVKHELHEHLLFSLEGGMARATDRLPLAAAGLDPEGKFFTVQSRIAWVF